MKALLVLIPVLAVAGCSGDVNDGDSSATGPAPSYTTDAFGNVVDQTGAVIATPPGVTVDPTTGGLVDQFGNPVDSLGNPVAMAVPSTAAPTVASAAVPVVAPIGSAPTAAPSVPAVGATESSRPFAEPTADATPLLARAWKLTHSEYRKSVEAFLGVSVDTSDFAAEIESNTYPNMADTGFVGTALAQDYFDTAEAAVAQLSETQLAAFSPSGTLDATQLDAYLSTAIARAFRRPVRDADLQRYRAIFDAASGGSDATLPYRKVLKGLIDSPYFLYRTEIGPEASEPALSFALTDHEMATFLSYSVLGEPPSAELIAAADRGELTTGGLATQVQTLLAAPGATTQFGAFLTQWLQVQRFADVHKFEDVFPGFDAVKPSMEAERDAFFAQSGTLASGSVTSLLTDPVPDMGAPLSDFYLSDGSATGQEERLGVLGLGTVLSSRAKEYLTSPTTRGLFIRARLMCQVITLPPDFTPEPITAVAEREQPDTTRQLYEIHVSKPECVTCHTLIDPLGFTLENFDGAGRARSTENGFAIDPTGELNGSDVDQPLASAAELSRALAQSQWTKECMAIQAFRFYYGAYEPSRGSQAILDARSGMGEAGQLGPMLSALLASTTATARVRE